MHPFGSPAVASPSDSTRSFAMPPLQAVCLYRGCEAITVPVVNHEVDPKKFESERLREHTALFAADPRFALEFRPHLKPMSHPGHVKSRALKKINILRKFFG
jgi:hypothetical protein